MKRLCLSPKTPKSLESATKKGVASLYIVIFATLLFGVITVSFARIILSEATQSSDDDLSRSAYDAALAGVEDAKTYVNRYYNCIKDKSESDCQGFNVFTTKYDTTNGAYNGKEAQDWNCDDGFPLFFKMHASPNPETGSKEVLIQEGNTEQGEFTDQAYTCVLVSDVVPDYRGTLSKDTRTKVIPLGINRGADGGSNLSAAKWVRFSWYSDMNRGTKTTGETFRNLTHNGSFAAKNQATIPPTMQLSFIRFNGDMDIEKTYHTDNTGSNYSTVVFLPRGDESGNPVKDENLLKQNVIKLSSSNPDDITLENAGNVRTTINGNEESLIHKPFQVYCTDAAEFACSVEIELPQMTNSDTAFLVASLPYGDAYTDFAVTLLDEGKNQIYLKGVQISVDSTGRTNQLVRRVEARLDPADLFFPYPQYALELGGGDEKSLQKDFWITNNCWYSNPSKNEIRSCYNNGTVGTGKQLNAGDLF